MATAESRPAWSPWRAIYAHNPFYLISALLVLYGLNLSIESAVTVEASCGLAAALAVYAAVLALVAWLVVRWCGVWDDARTILLAIAIVIMAMGNSFDLVAIRHPPTGRVILLLGCLYSLVLTEAILLTLGIRLQALVRIPTYLAWALVYLYPAYVADVVDDAHSWPPVGRAILAFSPLAALAILAFLPAARLPRERFADNGTPWAWPLFPWSLPVVLIAGIALRGYMLSMSFAPVRGNAATFEPYFLVLPLLAALTVAIELARTAGCRPWAAHLLLAPPLLVVLPLTSARHPFEDRFLHLLTEKLGTPFFLTLAAITLFYAYQWWRGSRLAVVGCYSGLAALCFVSPRSVDHFDLVAPQAAPLAVAALMALYAAIRRPSSLRWTFAASLLLATLTAAGADTWFADYGGFAPRHLTMVVLLTIGGVYRDGFAVLPRGLGAMSLAANCVASAVDPVAFIPPWGEGGLLAYEAALVLAGLVLAFLFASYLLLSFGIVSLITVLGTELAPLVVALGHRQFRDGFEPLAAGLGCLALALLITATKTACCRRTRWAVRRWRAI